MCASRRSAVWPQMVAVALLGLGAAGCADSSRFSDLGFDRPSPPPETTGSIQQQPAGRVESRPLPHIAGGGDGSSGGGRGMGSYQPGNADVTGSLPAPPPPRFTWEGGTPIVVARGETLETLARRYDVPASAIMEANGINAPAHIHPGQHLVIPRRRGPAAVASATQTHVASTAHEGPSTIPAGSARSALAPASSVHVVAPGETLHSIARLYHKSVLVIAKANNMAPDRMVRVGDRIVIPGAAVASAQQSAAPASVPVAGPIRGESSIASAESPHSARIATQAAPEPPPTAAKAAEPAGSLPSFRWPVRGRVIANL